MGLPAARQAAWIAENRSDGTPALTFIACAPSATPVSVASIFGLRARAALRLLAAPS